VEIPGSDVAASTLHSLFDLDIELKSKLDFSKLDHEKVGILGTPAQGTMGSRAHQSMDKYTRVGMGGLP
jgi:hypothetical protein